MIKKTRNSYQCSQSQRAHEAPTSPTDKSQPSRSNKLQPNQRRDQHLTTSPLANARASVADENLSDRDDIFAGEFTCSEREGERKYNSGDDL